MSESPTKPLSKWKVVPLANVAEIRLGKMLDKTRHQSGTRMQYLRNVNVRWGSVETEDTREMFFKNDELDRYGLKAGDVLVCEGGEPGRAAVWDGRVKGMKYQKALHRVRFNQSFEPKMLVYLLQHYSDTGVLERRFTGSTIKHFTREAFVQLPVPVPPIDEQQQIVAEIEKQFTRLDAGVALLKRTQAALKRYRASVLKAACEGRLVPTEAELARKEGRSFEPASVLLERILEVRRAKWKGRGKYNEPSSISSLGYEPDGLPEGWAWATVEQLGDVQLGRQRSPKNVSKNFPTKYIRAANITECGIDVSDVLEMEFTPTERERFALRDGDLILSEASGSPKQVGKPAIWRGEIPLCCFQNTVIRLRPFLLNARYVFLAFQHFYVNGVFARIAGGVGINHLGVEKFSAIPFALPPLAEQCRIVAEVERRMSAIEKMEAVVTANLQRATRLRQSILLRAFRGELAPRNEIATVKPPASRECEPLLGLDFSEPSTPEPRWEVPVPKYWSRAEVFDFAEREALRLGYTPGGDLWQIIRREGGRVASGDPEILGDTGMITVRGPKKFLVTLSPKSGRRRQQFTLAHELGHYFLHSDRGRRAIKVGRMGTGPIESEAHWFASAFLVPEKLLQQKIREGLRLKQLAEFFGVSEQVVEIRQKELR